VKTREYYVWPAGDQSDWTTKHTGEDCA
jgi:hypothetical protein